MYIAGNGSGFLVEAGCSCVIPETATSFLWFGKFEMTTGGFFECEAGIHYGTTMFSRDETFPATRMGIGFQLCQDLCIGRVLGEAAIIGEGEFVFGRSGGPNLSISSYSLAFCRLLQSVLHRVVDHPDVWRSLLCNQADGHRVARPAFHK